jgi:hypothetical protein
MADQRQSAVILGTGLLARYLLIVGVGLARFGQSPSGQNGYQVGGRFWSTVEIASGDESLWRSELAGVLDGADLETVVRFFHAVKDDGGGSGSDV